MKMLIVFKSGTQIEVDAEKFTVGRSQVNGELRSLRWDTPASAERVLKYVDLDQLVAVVAVHEPGDEPSEVEQSGGER